MVRKRTKVETGVGSVSESRLIFAFQLFLLVFTMAKLLEYIFGVAEAKSFAEFLNYWSKYDNCFNDSFPGFDVSLGIQKLTI